MAEFAYVNGKFSLIDESKISINDRGLQFGDAIYEVWAVKEGSLIDEEGHFQRLKRSLNELQIKFGKSDASLKIIFKALLQKNRVKNGIIYLQISRGTAHRDHPFPSFCEANIIITARSKNFSKLNERAKKGLSVQSQKDLRWGRVDIKTTNLLPNVLAKQKALQNGYDDVWLVDDNGFITEGSAQNAWIISKNNELITRPLSENILAGITRATIMKIAYNLGFKIIERNFKIDEVKNAKEAFITSATSFVTPIISINDCKINDGKIGEISIKLRENYLT